MKPSNKIFFFICFGLLVGGLSSLSVSAESVDNRIYAELLHKYVRDGIVDYEGFQSQETLLDQYLSILEKVDPMNLSRKSRFAFYVNAYNAWTIKLILSKYPHIQSIKDIGSFFKSPWKRKLCRINGDIITLDDIEHNILRPQFRDPRVHFAINCASASCPPLRSEPYVGESLNEQLDDAVEKFINNPQRNRMEGTTLYLSKIFKWFPEDFGDDVLDFILQYAKGDLRSDIELNRDILKVKYLDYDWALNEIKRFVHLMRLHQTYS
jgi:hypothetical protein